MENDFYKYTHHVKKSVNKIVLFLIKNHAIKCHVNYKKKQEK
jgi:hypothetical protein